MIERDWRVFGRYSGLSRAKLTKNKPSLGPKFLARSLSHQLRQPAVMSWKIGPQGEPQNPSMTWVGWMDVRVCERGSGRYAASNSNLFD